MTSQNLHNDELGRFTFSYSFPKPYFAVDSIFSSYVLFLSQVGLKALLATFSSMSLSNYNTLG
jgi:hypothetical protein